MIILLGGNGSIGKRYQAILNHMNQPYEVIDRERVSVEHFNGKEFSRVIIATPTDTHKEYVEILSTIRKPFLCEKPVSQSMLDARHMARLSIESGCNNYVVNNYTFVKTYSLNRSTAKEMYYNFFTTGRDGIVWDTCQLVHMAKKHNLKLKVARRNYRWTFNVDKKEVPYREIEDSYFQMLKAWLENKREYLWDMSEGAKMTESCQEVLSKFPRIGEIDEFEYDPATFQVSVKEKAA